MHIEGEALRVQVFIGESDRVERRPLHEAIVEMLRAEGCAGATVVRGVEGFGANSRIHTANILRLSEDLPVVITFVDSAERVERILPKLDEMVSGGLVTIDEVRVFRYRPAE
jgi:PII-like signaling protein